MTVQQEPNNARRTPRSSARARAVGPAAGVLAAFLAAAAAAAGAAPPKQRGSAQTATAPARKPAPGERIDFPADGSAPYDRIGLFIGIDNYPRLQPLDGCANDARAMRALFARRFGFRRSATLTDGQATRRGILQMLEALIDQVRTARKKVKRGEPVSVVIYYAGHGSQVRDQATVKLGKDEDDARDETWVAFDSSLRGDRDVRDDEIRAVYRELVRLGAQVLLISDSCHSGTLHRSAEFAKTRMVYRKDPGAGPPLHAFANIPRQRGGDGGPAAQPGLVEDKPMPGFVAYTACGPTERANEDEDDAGRPCGRFTKVLRRLLAEISPETTYGQLHRRVLLEFEKNYRSRRQTPQFYAVAGKRNEVFLRGGYPIAHAAVLGGTQRRGTVRLNMGLLHGVTRGSVFSFYRTLDDLRDGSRRIAVGRVEKVEAETCLVRLDGEDARIPDDAKAALDSVRMVDLKVHVATDLPKPMKDVLAELDRDKQLELVGAKQPFSVALYHDAKSKTIRLYSPAALPDARRAASAQPQPIREFRYGDAGRDADVLSRNLLYLARLQRVMSLERNGDKMQADIRMSGGPGKAADGLGLRVLQEGDEFKIRLRNDGPKPVYVTVFAFNPAGRSRSGTLPRKLEILYPLRADVPEPIRPGREFVIEGFTATAQTPLERTTIKVLATESNVDFSPLVVPPQRGGAPLQVAPATRGAQSPLFALLKEAMHGGPRTRGASRKPPDDMYWATATLVFDVKKKAR